MASRDLENLKQKQKLINELHMVLGQAATRAAYIEAARTVVHNLANLIQSIGTELDVIRQEADSKNKNFSNAVSTLEDKIETIEEVIDFYRRLKNDVGSIRTFDVNEMLEEAIDFCKGRAERYRITVELKQSDAPIILKCPEANLLQAFMNIIVNAIDAVSEQTVGKKRILVRVLDASPEKVIIKLEDTGIGIREQDLSRVWESDFTTKKERGGTGLGLPHVKRTINDIGGEVVLNSSIGRGTTVSITIPRGT